MRASNTIAVLLLTIILVACAQPAQQPTPATGGDAQQPTSDNPQPAQADAPRPLKIGVMVPRTGDAATYGESVLRAVQMAAKDKPIELVVEDTRCDAKTAVSAITKLTDVDHVDAIIGEICSGATLPAAPIAEEKGTVLISPSATSPKITNAGTYTFRVVPSDSLQGVFGAKLVMDSGFSDLAILYTNDEYGVGFSDVLGPAFENLDGSIVAKETFARGSTDLRTQLTKIAAAKPEAIYIISSSPDGSVAALRQIKEIGINVTVFGSEGLKAQEIIDGAKGAAEGMIVSSVSSGTTSFAAAHMAAYGEAPGPFAAQGYDALDALWRAGQGTTTRAQLRDKLATLSFDGMSGAIAFDANGDVSGNYDVFIVKDGAFVLQ